MRLKYHLELETEGILILESEPQIRNIFVYSQLGNTARLPFPYIEFVIRYIKDDKGQLYFPGVWGSGLRVYGSLKPLNSMLDDVFLLPTDDRQGGYVCTNHMYDMYKFSSLEIMTKTIISLWWNVNHMINQVCYNKIRNMSLEQILKPGAVDWCIPHRGRKNKSSFWDALKAGYSNWQGNHEVHGVPTFDTSVPIDGIIIDEPWDNKKIKLVIRPDAELPLKRKRGRPKKNET